MRNLQIFLSALIAAAYIIVDLVFPNLPWLARLLPALALGVLVHVIFQHLRRRQNIKEYTMEETGMIGLGLDRPGKKKGTKS